MLALSNLQLLLGCTNALFQELTILWFNIGDEDSI